MMTEKVVDLIPRGPVPNEELISELTNMLNEAKTGHLQSILGTMMFDNSVIDTINIGNEPINYITNLGMIEDLKQEIIHNYNVR